MTTHIVGDEVITLDERDERARRAVRAFRALQPTLSAYARVLTRRQDVRVEMSTGDNGSTDGKRIFYRPPLALGDATEHNRRLCDKRDENKQLLCEACRIREQVLVPIYHEIAHIAWDSFAQPTDADKARLVREAVAGMDSEYARKIEERIMNAPGWQTRSYMGLVGVVSKFLPTMLNALEDARINAAQFQARKGTKVMFDADTWRVFNDGVEQYDSATGQVVVKSWKDYPQNMQFMVGLFCKASGYDYHDWFIPPVVEALDDPEITRLVNQLHTVRSTRGVYELIFPLLARSKELGFCKEDTDPEPEPEPLPSPSEDEGEPGDTPEGEESDESGESEGSSSGGSNSEDAESDSTDGESTSSDGSSNGSGTEEDSGGDRVSSSDDSNSEQSSGETDQESDEAESSESADEFNSPSDANGQSGDSGDSEEDEIGADEADSDSSLSDGSPGSRNSDISDESEDNSGQSGSNPDTENSPTFLDNSDESGHSKEQEKADDSGDESLIDSGADEGEGGTEIIEDESWDHIPMGDESDIEEGLKEWTGHGEKPKSIPEETYADKQAVDRAIIQGLYFETPSRFIFGVRIHHFGEPVMVEGYDMSRAWDKTYSYLHEHRIGKRGEYSTPESILGNVLLKMRVAFSANRRGSYERNKKSGKVNASALGKRAFHDDERLFKKKVLPGKRDYFVVIGLDVSGSTVGTNIDLIKRAAFAQATLLSRMGIKFAVYAHSGNYHSPTGGRGDGLDLDIYVIKEAEESWDSKVQERLIQLGSDSANLDGHSIEFYRKLCDRRSETDKVILYFSDGKMPAENYDEELEILQREIRICKSKGYTLLGVGIRTDSPARHGLDTVQIDNVSDLHKVVDQIGKYLAK